VAGNTEAGTPIIRNPATRPVMEFLDNVLALSRFVPVPLFFVVCLKSFKKTLGRALNGEPNCCEELCNCVSAAIVQCLVMFIGH